MSSVQNDIWTLLTVLAVGVVPLGVVLFMLRRPRPFEPSGGKGPPPGREALFENEITSFKDEDFEEPPVYDSPLSWKERTCYMLAVMLAGCALSSLMLAALRWLLAKGIYL